MKLGPRPPRRPVAERIDMARFAAAVRDQVQVQVLMRRFDLSHGAVTKLRARVLAEHPEWTPPPGTRTL